MLVDLLYSRAPRSSSPQERRAARVPGQPRVHGTPQAQGRALGVGKRCKKRAKEEHPSNSPQDSSTPSPSGLVLCSSGLLQQQKQLLRSGFLGSIPLLWQVGAVPRPSCRHPKGSFSYRGCGKVCSTRPSPRQSLLGEDTHPHSPAT